MKTDLALCGFCILTLSLSTALAGDNLGLGSLPAADQSAEQVLAADPNGDSVSHDLISTDTQELIAADERENPGKAKGKGKGKGKAKGHDKDKRDGESDSDSEPQPAQPAQQPTQPPTITPATPQPQPTTPAPVPAQPQPAQTREQVPQAPASTSAKAPARRPAEIKAEFDRRMARLDVLDNNTAVAKAGLAVVARETGVPEATLQAQRRAQPVATAGLLIANELAKTTGKTAVSFIKLRRQSRTWYQIAAANKLDLTPVLPKLERLEQAMAAAQPKRKS